MSMVIRSSRNGIPRSALGSSGSLSVTDKDEPLHAKRKFRVYHEFAGDVVVRMVITKDFYLTFNKLWTGLGAARMQIMTGGTPGGTFTTINTKFCINTVGGDIPGAAVFAAGGTHTGGTEREVLRSDSGVGGPSKGDGDNVANTRYLAAGTYYFRIVVTGTTSGMWNMEYEEATPL